MQNNQVNGGGNVQMNNNESANNISEDFDNLVASMFTKVYYYINKY